MRNNAIENTNPYNGNSVAMRPNNPLASIQSPKAAEEVARILGQIQVAKAFPRDMYQVNNEIESAFSRMKLAQESVYTYSRGGTNITGPTIRTLEQIATCMQNITYGYDEIETNMKDHYTKIRCFAYDLEKNTRSEIEVFVSHKRTGKNQEWLTDPRDIYETVASQASRRIRSCLQRIIPEDIVEYALETSEKTIKANVAINADTVKKLAESFRALGVNKDMIEEFLQRKIASITPDQYLRLRSIWVSLRDGVAKVEDFFDLNLSDNAKAAQKAKKMAEKPVDVKDEEITQTPFPNAEESKETASDEPTEDELAELLNGSSPF